MGGALTIRPATEADHAAIARICLVTGATGSDATGDFGDDAAISDVFATPYLHGPGGFCLVWDGGDGPVGYVLGTTTTREFQEWFVRDWWPSLPARVAHTAADGWLLPSAADPARMLIERLDEFPAHLHIDLLPSAQGMGVGRALIEAACALIAARGVSGVHLVASRDNAGAVAFYPRVGFAPIANDAGSVTFARTLR